MILTTAIVLAVVIFLIDYLGKKRSVLLTRQSGIACFKNRCSRLEKGGIPEAVSSICNQASPCCGSYNHLQGAALCLLGL